MTIQQIAALPEPTPPGRIAFRLYVTDLELLALHEVLAEWGSFDSLKGCLFDTINEACNPLPLAGFNALGGSLATTDPDGPHSLADLVNDDEAGLCLVEGMDLP